jgi:hypothetical protein
MAELGKNPLGQLVEKWQEWANDKECPEASRVIAWTCARQLEACLLQEQPKEKK